MVAAQLGKKVTVCDRVISLVRLRVIRAGPIRLGKLRYVELSEETAHRRRPENEERETCNMLRRSLELLPMLYFTL